MEAQAETILKIGGIFFIFRKKFHKRGLFREFSVSFVGSFDIEKRIMISWSSFIYMSFGPVIAAPPMYSF